MAVPDQSNVPYVGTLKDPHGAPPRTVKADCPERSTYHSRNRFVTPREGLEAGWNSDEGGLNELTCRGDVILKRDWRIVDEDPAAGFAEEESFTGLQILEVLRAQRDHAT